MKKSKTERGFTLYEFQDRNGVECNIQESSLATESAIWIGAEKIGLKEFISFRGWKDFAEFDECCTPSHHYVANNRMHLTQEQVKKILPLLQHFAQTGELP